MYRIL